MSIQENTTRASRRTTITWMLKASATIPFLNAAATAEEASGYDPKLGLPKKDLWPRTFNKSQLPLVAALTDIILPDDFNKASGSALHIPDFIDEWISAPYAVQQNDRQPIIAGLNWINKEARKRFKKGFTKLSRSQQLAICNDISDPITAKPFYESAVAFFLLFQKLTYGAYYSTETGKAELGNNPLPTFELPEKEEQKSDDSL